MWVLILTGTAQTSGVVIQSDELVQTNSGALTTSALTIAHFKETPVANLLPDSTLNRAEAGLPEPDDQAY